MKTIYSSMTPRTNWSPPQTVDATLVAEHCGRRFKVTIRFDTYYTEQSHGSVECLVGDAFKPVLTLHAHEIPCVQSYHAWEDRGAKGDWLRSGTGFEETIRSSLRVLVETAAMIMGTA